MKILFWATIVILLLCAINNDLFALDLPKELVMKTDSGEIVLTSEPCTFTKMGLQGYEYAAYATEQGHANHEGCWQRDSYEGKSSVQIFFPEINATAVYNPNLFKPRSAL